MIRYFGLNSFLNAKICLLLIFMKFSNFTLTTAMYWRIWIWFVFFSVPQGREVLALHPYSSRQDGDINFIENDKLVIINEEYVHAIIINIKSTWGGGEVLTCSYTGGDCLCRVCFCARPLDQTKNYRDRRFGTHTALDHI